MPRIARKNIETNYIHLIVQGINKEYIFQKNEWKEEYIKILKKKLKENIEIISYCIMDNHAHFLIYYKNIEELSNLMQKVNTSYAMKYNKVNKRKGYVFRDRYYAQPILTEEQLNNCMVYIHKNPINAKKTKTMKEYRYSSYNEYINVKNLVTLKGIKLMFGSKDKYYEEFKNIHKVKSEIEDIADVGENDCNANEIINKYERKSGKNVEQLRENEEVFGELLLELREKGNISLREMSKIFGINKDKLNRYIHRIIDESDKP